MKKSNTLVILTPGFPVNEADTVCLPPQQVFLRSLKQSHPELDIVILSFEYPHHRSPYQWFGMAVIPFGGNNRGGLRRRLNWLQVWLTLWGLNKHKNIVGILSFWVDECAFIGHHFAKRHKLKHFAWILGQDAKPGNRYFKLIKPQDGSLIALSDAVRREVHQNYGVRPQHIIPVGLDTSLFTPGNYERRIDILGAGSLIPLKQYDVFIETVKIISGYIPNIRAVICGKGPEKDKLLQLIKEHGLEKNVVLRYEVPHKEVLALMQQAKVFLHTSEYEGFGAVISEALYAGAQVVSFVKPMDNVWEHHHVVKNRGELNRVVLELLLDADPNNDAVLVYPVQQVVATMTTLIGVSTTQFAPFAGL